MPWLLIIEFDEKKLETYKSEFMFCCDYTNWERECGLKNDFWESDECAKDFDF